MTGAKTPTACKDCGREVVSTYRWKTLTAEQRRALKGTHSRGSLETGACDSCSRYRARNRTSTRRLQVNDPLWQEALRALQTAEEEAAQRRADLQEPDIPYDGGWIRVGQILRPVRHGRELEDFGERAS